MKRSKTTPETVGERLRKAREKAGFSVDDVAKRTKIHPRIIAAFEEDQPVERLSPVYVRSFLRMYARLVGLNEGSVLQDYATDQAPGAAVAVEEPRPMPLGRHAEAAPEEPLTPPSPPMWRPSGRQIKTVAVILIAVGVAMGLGWIITHRPIHHHPRAVTAAAPARIKRSSAARQKPRPAAAPQPAAVAAMPTVAIPLQEPLRLSVSANDRAWLRVIADGKVIFQNVLERGKTETWSAQNTLSLWLGNAGSVELTLNGKSLGAPGRRGEIIKDLQITHAGIKRL